MFDMQVVFVDGGAPFSDPDTDFAPNEVTLGEVLVEMVQDDARELARRQALMYRSVWLVTEASLEAGGGGEDFMADEVRAALLLTRRSAEHLVRCAAALCVDLPDVWQALYDGRIDDRRARVVVDALEHLDRDTARAFTARVLEDAPDLTSGQLRARLSKLLVEFDPANAQERYEAGVARRSVQLTANPDGTSNLAAYSLPADRATALMRKIATMARRLPKDDRTADQKRADVFLDLLDGETGTTAPNRATVDIRVDLTTLLGWDNRSAEIPGWGPIVADLARRVVDEQVGERWQVTVTDRDVPISVDVMRRRPKAGLRRTIEAKIPTCVFPGCRVPSSESDIDHRRDHAKGGPTIEANLEPACRHDHRLKSEAGWSLDRVDREFVWTSPLGIKYASSPQGP